MELMLAVETATELLTEPCRWHPFFHSITNHKGKQVAVNRGAWRDVEGMRGGGDGRGRRGGADGGAHGRGTRGGLVTAKRNAAAAAIVKEEDKKSLGAGGAGVGRGGEKNGEDLVRAGMVLRLVSSSPIARSCVISSLLLLRCVSCASCSPSLLLRFLLSALARLLPSVSCTTHTHTHTRTHTHTPVTRAELLADLKNGYRWRERQKAAPSTASTAKQASYHLPPVL